MPSIIPYRDIQHPDGLVRVEYYHEFELDDEGKLYPMSWNKFCSRMQNFYGDVGNPWQTLVFESITMAEISARKYHEKIINPFPYFAPNKDMRQWSFASTSELEDKLICLFGGFDMNVLLTTHVHTQMVENSGEVLRGPYSPGRLASRGMLSANYSEQFRHYTAKDDKGVKHYNMQTQNDGFWKADTQINAPELCYPHYESIWENWDKENKKRKYLHGYSYGDTGTGKSTFAVSWPKPMLVILFDGMGKDTPYYKYYDLEEGVFKMAEVGELMMDWDLEGE